VPTRHMWADGCARVLYEPVAVAVIDSMIVAEGEPKLGQRKVLYAHKFGRT
jgi:hypothetical protein